MNVSSFDMQIRSDQDPTRIVTVRCTGLLRTIAGKRCVYEGRWDGRDVIVKVFTNRLRSGLHWKREYRGLSLLHQRGIAAPELLLTGRNARNRQVIVTQKVPESRDLASAFEQCPHTQGRKDLLFRWIDFVAGMHEKGVVQNDLHMGNFMTAGLTLYALDPAQMNFQKCPLDKKTSLRQLAMLVCAAPFANRTEPEPFLDRYCEARDWKCIQDDIDFFRTCVTKAWQKSIRRTLKKTLRDSRRFFSIRNGGFRGIFNRDFITPESAREFISALDRRMEKGQILKRGNTCFVSRIQVGEQDVVVKRFNYKGIWHSLRHTLKGSRARKCWLFGHRLISLMIPCAAPLALVEKRRLGIVQQSYIVNTFIEGSSLHAVFNNPDYPAQERKAILDKVESCLQQLRRHHLTHADLKLTNILICRGNPVFIDLDSMQRHRNPVYFEYRFRKMILHFQNRLYGKRI